MDNPFFKNNGPFKFRDILSDLSLENDQNNQDQNIIDILGGGYLQIPRDVKFEGADALGNRTDVQGSYMAQLMFFRSFDLPFGGLEGSVAYIDFTADDSSLLQDEDQFVFAVSKSF